MRYLTPTIHGNTACFLLIMNITLMLHAFKLDSLFRALCILTGYVGRYNSGFEITTKMCFSFGKV